MVGSSPEIVAGIILEVQWTQASSRVSSDIDDSCFSHRCYARNSHISVKTAVANFNSMCQVASFSWLFLGWCS